MLDGWDVSCLDSSRQALKWHQIQSAEAGQPAWSTYARHVTFLDPNVKLQTLVHWLRRWWWGRNPKAGHENSSILSNLTIDHFTPLNNPARDLFCFVAASHQVSSVGRFAFRIPCLMLGHHGSFGNGCQRYQVLRLAPISASASEGSPAIRIGQVTGQEIRSTWLPEVQRTSQNINQLGSLILNFTRRCACDLLICDMFDQTLPFKMHSGQNCLLLDCTVPSSILLGHLISNGSNRETHLVYLALVHRH